MSRLSKVPEVTHIVSPLAPAVVSQGQISKDQHSVVVRFDIKGKAEDAHKRVKPVLDASAAAQRAHPASPSRSSATRAPDTRSTRRSATTSSARSALRSRSRSLILLFAFGAFVAAGVPVLLAFSARARLARALGPRRATSSHASDATQSVILLMGMAVGVDYSLFYLKREREERARGTDGRDARCSARRRRPGRRC